MLLEAQLIKRYRPPFNVLLRDDKSFPFILLRADHAYPRIMKHRGARKAKGNYYGPFASAGSVNKTLNALQKLFLLRSCTDSFFNNRDRPCLLYQIKRCSAPCVGRIDEAGYASLVREAKDFLGGKSGAVQTQIEKQMARAAEDLDFETAAKTSGARFVMLKGAVARIHRALAQFMIDTHVDENGLTEHMTPVLVRDEAMYGTDKLPKFGDDSYQTTNGWWLIPTSEVTLTYSVAGDVLEEAALPRRMTAHTLCFRSEAGSAGRDTSGMLRQHQFEKVEMVSVTHPDQSDDEQKRMLRCAEDMLERLGVPYRTVILCTGDMGFGARRTFDIEAWLPGQNAYREISSVSTTGDFQARRMNARFKPADGGKPQFVHTLNGSGLAVGRCLIAVLENGQQADGSVKLPDVLAPYLGGKTTLGVDGTLS
ncbi:serine--tRNA ligase [uncultured Sulfitobacter sp.]|uniref:serine--tRNA ligase n=1 Tax=uncultured Sulfitobacter sp. TaxID=191468 RepID=UPI0025977371|nr:serine--tRNA ligase [uncultured Sulfitobacter sp.]